MVHTVKSRFELIDLFLQICLLALLAFYRAVSFFASLLFTVLTAIFWVSIIRLNSSLICLYFSSVPGVRARTDSSSRLSPTLFFFLLNALRPVRGEQWARAHGETEKERKRRKRERSWAAGTYTYPLSADHVQINVVVDFTVLVLWLWAVAHRVVCVGVWAVTAI